MKILTTQNLINSANISTNIKKPNTIRENNSSSSVAWVAPEEAQHDSLSISFKGKKNILDKAIDAGKKAFGERVANWKWVKKLLKSDSFGKALEFTGEQEVMIQSITALAICCLLRPATIRALPGDKNKRDCDYAAAHSFSSGVFGFIVPLLCIKPLANGYNHALKNAGEYISDPNKLKRIWPHLDIKSITNFEGKRLPMDEWKDILGNKFIADIKDVRKIPLPKHISKVSDETIAKHSNGPEWIDSEGQNLKIAFEDIYLGIQEAVKGRKGKEKKLTHYYQLATMDEKLLEELYPQLDISSVKLVDGKRAHLNLWKNKDGSEFKISRKNIFISDFSEAESSIPFITGRVREDAPGKFKDVCYQKNNNRENPFSLGTPIEQDMVDADYVNQVVNKLGAWLPDIVVAYPRATATIALIPFVLKNVFGLEKSKKPASQEQTALQVDASRKAVS